MSALQTLLEVQERDTAADRLRHRRTTLAERAELAGLEQQLGALDTRLEEARARRDRVVERQVRLDADIRLLDDRVAELERLLYGGTVSASRELQAMVAEVNSIKARRSRLEDDALAAIEEGEPLVAEVSALEEQRAALLAEAARVRGVIAEAEAAIDAEIAVEEEAKAELSGAVPPELLSTYERLREKMGGIGAARLVGGSCSGCHLTLPMSELARIKKEPPEALVLCDQCGRILVR
jgi:predicted  nucleic acid-binding Zn-ribbon protein